MAHRIFLATNNAHKVTELAELWKAGRGPGELLSALACGGMPEVEETGATFGENALLKARALLPRLQSGNYALADDSGLEVDALNGAPGLYSARYAGAGATDGENIALVLRNLHGMPAEKRRARFRCALCLLDASGRSWIFEGRCEGTLLTEPQGKGGFGYDPIFQPDGHEGSFATLGPEIKNALSHRVRALRELIRHWPEPQPA